MEGDGSLLFGTVLASPTTTVTSTSTTHNLNNISNNNSSHSRHSVYNCTEYLCCSYVTSILTTAICNIISKSRLFHMYLLSTCDISAHTIYQFIVLIIIYRKKEKKNRKQRQRKRSPLLWFRLVF